MRHVDGAANEVRTELPLNVSSVVSGFRAPFWPK